jgi:hypothetical protein
MQGNPHHERATSRLHNGTTNEVTRAQAEATLALAFEQRTANLIALYSMDDGARQGMVDGAGMHSGNWVDVTKQIQERLGLK